MTLHLVPDNAPSPSAATDAGADAGSTAPVTAAAAVVLRAVGVPEADADARALVHASGGDPVVLAGLLARRSAREPLAHLVGGVHLGSVHMLVGPGMFVPQPETIDVATGALELMLGLTSPLVVDLCSGGGTLALLIATARPDATVHAVERSAVAVEWLTANIIHTGIHVTAHHADAAEALHALDGQVDVVVSNPPYVADHEGPGVAPEVRDHDPAVALYAGNDGLDVIRVVAAAAMRLLKPAGLLVVEHSDRQGRTAPALLTTTGWTQVNDHQDSQGRDRWTTAHRP